MKRFLASVLAAFASFAFGATTTPVQLLNPAGSTAGQAIVSTGASTPPAWGNISMSVLTGVVPVSKGGTNAAAASGSALDNITGFSGTGFLTRTGAGTYAFQSAANGITLGNLVQTSANTVLANATGSTANVTAFAMPSCSTSTSALQYTSGTGFTCYANSATTTGTLAQFSATTSAQLAGVISDETGSGSLVFSASPTFTGTLTAANVTASGTLTGFKGRLLNIQVFSTTGTYTPTTGTAAVYVKVQAGGGAGGGTPATSTGQAAAGSGGTAGAYAEGYYTSGFSGVTVTVGTGGAGVSGSAGGAGSTSSFGALLSCPGGAGGAAGTANAGPWVTAGSGITAACTGTSLFATQGGQGGQSVVVSATVSKSGDGAPSMFGPGPTGTWSAPAVGFNAQSFGASGSGANAPASTAAQAGAAGKQGFVEVFELSQ